MRLQAFPVHYLRLVQPRGYRAMPRRLANRELLRTFSRLPDAFPSLQTRSTRPLKRTHVGKLLHLITLSAVLVTDSSRIVTGEMGILLYRFSTSAVAHFPRDSHFNFGEVIP